MLSVSQGLQLWLEHLVYSAGGHKGESRIFVRKEGEWRFPPMEPEQALRYLSLYIEGYRQGMNKPLLLLPESGGAWIKNCYDVQNDAMLTDDASLQKARSKFVQAYEGNMMVRGEGKMSGINVYGERLSRDPSEPSQKRHNVTCYRCLNLISPECCIKIAQYGVFIYYALLITD
jgi:exonuclease V gamma subunit